MSAASELPSSYYNMEYGKQVAILVVQAFSASLSILGSGAVMFSIFCGNKIRTGGLFYRIMFGLSFCDVLHSLGHLISPYLQPAGNNLVGAVGNTTSCSIIAFVMTFGGIGAIYYNFFLSFYYHKVIRHSVSERDLVQKYELWVHGISWTVAGVSCISLAALTVFNSAELPRACSSENYPLYCNEDGDLSDCERGQNTMQSAYAVLTASIVPAVAGIVYTCRVYLTVRGRLRKSRRFRFENDHDNRQVEKERKVATQAVLYSCAFLNTFSWVVAYALVEDLKIADRNSVGNTGVFIFLFCLSLFAPMQGFFNAWIFARPRIQQWHQADPTKGWLWALEKVLMGQEAPTRRSSSIATRTSNKSKFDVTGGLNLVSNRAFGSGDGLSQPQNHQTQLGGLDDKNEETSDQEIGTGSTLGSTDWPGKLP